MQSKRVFGPFGGGEDFVVMRIVETKIVGHFPPTDKAIEGGEKSGREIPRRLLNLEQTAKGRELTRGEQSGKGGGIGGGRGVDGGIMGRTVLRSTVTRVFIHRDGGIDGFALAVS